MRNIVTIIILAVCCMAAKAQNVDGGEKKHDTPVEDPTFVPNVKVSKVID